MSEIKIGSTVRIKSGGPLMTVISFALKSEGRGLDMKNVEDSESVICQWFDDTKLQKSTFPLESLVLSDDRFLGIYKS